MELRSISGSLASPDVLVAIDGESGAPGPLRMLLASARRALGPVSPARTVLDLQVAPLFRELGLDISIVADDAVAVVATFTTGSAAPAGMVVAGAWGTDLRRLRDRTARTGPPLRWWIGANGLVLRLMDVSRAHTRRVLDFDLARLEDEEDSLAVLRRLLSWRDGGLGLLDAAVSRSAAHRVEVGRSLQGGVQDALSKLVMEFGRGLGRRRPAADVAFADALTVVYRILFLLFAEARGLVPRWHPVYRESYTIESLRPAAEGREPPAGLWESLQAISRLAHRGCTAGSLRVVPFNGRLFAPSAAPLADSFRLDDRVARDVLLAVTTRPGADRRERIAYGDLGVEQLGAVYERVLDFTPGGERRKPSGTFYTPRAMTEYLVRRTLAPLVSGRTAAEILTLRVVDPAMGSGAFLVAACRFLADAYEAALIADGTATAAAIGPPERASFRRAVAQRCLYGVDINPTAVQLARLSLWLCTLAADRPLSFLDHHLRVGDSLIGARAVDVARQPPGRSGRRAAPLPLFDADDLIAGVASAVGTRVTIAGTPDDTASDVHRKERTMEQLSGARGPLARWRTSADAWCAAWFWPDGPPLTPRDWTALATALRGGASGLPRERERAWLATAGQVATARRFFHWELEFPEVFFDPDGTPATAPGFDAVIGNPPWADAGSAKSFGRDSGCYRFQGRGHANLYQMFAERMLELTAPGGRVGMLMPSGLLADHGCAELRRHLFERFEVDAVLGFDNREALFPIHRGLHFTLITASRGGPTREVSGRFGLRSAGTLEDIPDRGEVPGSVRLPLTLIRRFSGDGLALPEIESEHDRAILAKVLSAVPALADPDGWHLHVGRELNATDDKPHFGSHGLPILEGKHVEPFRAMTERATRFITAATAERLLGGRCHFRQARLGYREVASATNRLTLIAAVIPAGSVTTHTVFCVRRDGGNDDELQWYLCGIFNSFVANYLVRLRGAVHLPAATIHRLPVPLLARDDRGFERIAVLSRIAHGSAEARAEIHARSALAYGLDAAEFVHVLGSFPLVATAEREAARLALARLGDGV